MKPLQVFILLYIMFAVSLLIVAIEFTIDLRNHRRATEDLPQPSSLLRDYQIEVDNDSIYVWDGTREVGSSAWGSGKFDSIILKDNPGPYVIESR